PEAVSTTVDRASRSSSASTCGRMSRRRTDESRRGLLVPNSMLSRFFMATPWRHGRRCCLRQRPAAPAARHPCPPLYAGNARPLAEAITFFPAKSARIGVAPAADEGGALLGMNTGIACHVAPTRHHLALEPGPPAR